MSALRFPIHLGEILEQVEHILDQSLLVHVVERGHASTQDVERLEGHVRALAGVGADVVLVTCSSLSPYVERFQASLPVPVAKLYWLSSTSNLPT